MPFNLSQSHERSRQEQQTNPPPAPPPPPKTQARPKRMIQTGSLRPFFNLTRPTSPVGFPQAGPALTHSSLSKKGHAKC